jgi:UDP-N-acetylmuramate dehydrogenase
MSAADGAGASAEFIEQVRLRVRGEIKENEPMASHTSFRIGGPADLWVEPETIEDIIALVDMCEESDVGLMTIGRGTNLLVRDGGIRGVVMGLEKACAKMEMNPPSVKAGAGVSLAALAKEAAKQGLSGLEFASGIPGLVGGSLAVNAGAWGGSLCDRLRSALVYDPAKKALRTIGKDELDFGYRKSNLATFGIILEAEFDLEPGDHEEISERMKQYRFQRAESQPLGFKSAGCVFKNPVGGYAGILIDALGLKGRMCGDAMVSDVHANFIVNTGEAGAADVAALIKEIKERVIEASGIELEEEIQVVGEA